MMRAEGSGYGPNHLEHWMDEHYHTVAAARPQDDGSPSGQYRGAALPLRCGEATERRTGALTFSGSRRTSDCRTASRRGYCARPGGRRAPMPLLHPGFGNRSVGAGRGSEWEGHPTDRPCGRVRHLRVSRMTGIEATEKHTRVSRFPEHPLGIEYSGQSVSQFVTPS